MNLHQLITDAFKGVVLGGGISLRQAQVVDKYGEGVTDAEFDNLPLLEITHDWTQVSFEELERNCVAHLDAEGYRYYIPAFMLSVITHYESASMRVIGTLLSLYVKNDSFPYHMNQYSLLNQTQREVIAKFIHELPTLIPIEDDDLILTQRALRNYWGQFLKP